MLVMLSDGCLVNGLSCLLGFLPELCGHLSAINSSDVLARLRRGVRRMRVVVPTGGRCRIGSSRMKGTQTPSLHSEVVVDTFGCIRVGQLDTLKL